MDAEYFEIWEDISGYENLYQVSNLGRVRSLDRAVTYSNGFTRIHKGKVLKQIIDKDGYATVGLSKNGKQKRVKVHRLVAEAFLPNPLNLPIVNHKDENPSNNNMCNLEWCTYAYNTKYSDVGHRSWETKVRNKLAH